MGLNSPAIARFTLKATDEHLLALRREGLWSGEIAARTGMTAAAVRVRFHLLRRRGVEIPRPSGSRPNARRRASNEQLIALAQSGLRTTLIAAGLGISPAVVRSRVKVLRRRGLLPPAAPSGPDATARDPA